MIEVSPLFLTPYPITIKVAITTSRHKDTPNSFESLSVSVLGHVNGPQKGNYSIRKMLNLLLLWGYRPPATHP